MITLDQEVHFLVAALALGIIPTLIHLIYIFRSLGHARQSGVSLFPSSLGEFREHLRIDPHAKFLYRRTILWFFVTLTTWVCVGIGVFLR